MPSSTSPARLAPAQAPTTFLPPLGKLSSTTSTQIYEALSALRALYFPHTQPNPTLLLSSLGVSAGSTCLDASKGSLPRKTRLAEVAFANNTFARNVIASPTSTGYSTPVIDSGYASAYVSDNEDDGDDEVESKPPSCCSLLCDSADLENLERECKTLEVLRVDTFERTFVLRWLTGFVSRAEVWVEEGTAIDDDLAEGKSVEVKENIGQEYTLRSALLEEALDVLAAFTPVDEQGDEDEEEDPSYMRTLTFKLPPMEDQEEEEDGPLTMQINDARINEDDHTSVGLQTWGSSIIFAERLCLDPSLYISPPLPAAERKPFRILELGAGTGILSIVVEKLFARSLCGDDVKREIVATDFHPEVLDNLRKNVEINFPSAPTALPIDVHTLDWQHPPSHAPFDNTFDLILAADVVYHPDHARWIRGCVERLLSPNGVFWMFIALRASGRHEGLDGSVDDIFGPVVSAEPSSVDDGEKRLAILETERLGRKSSGIGRADECAYRLFKIGWVR